MTRLNAVRGLRPNPVTLRAPDGSGRSRAIWARLHIEAMERGVAPFVAPDARRRAAPPRALARPGRLASGDCAPGPKMIGSDVPDVEVDAGREHERDGPGPLAPLDCS